MARIVRTFTVERPIDEVFDAIADFARAQDWDPGVRSSEHAAGPRVGHGASFALDVSLFGPFGMTLVYETSTYDRPDHVVHQVRTALVEGIDDITLAEDAGDSSPTTTVTWDATFRFRGPAGWFDALLQRGFEQVGDHAVDGLERWLRAGGRGTSPT